MEPLRVLFGYDGSIGADAALAAVTTLPWSAGTHLRVIGVRDAHLRFLRPLADEILFAEFEDVVSRAARCLRAEVPLAAIDDRVVRGPAVPRILAEAERLGADLIVVGSRNQGPMRSAILGSVAHDPRNAFEAHQQLGIPFDAIAAVQNFEPFGIGTWGTQRFSILELGQMHGLQQCHAGQDAVVEARPQVK